MIFIWLVIYEKNINKIYNRKQLIFIAIIRCTYMCIYIIDVLSNMYKSSLYSLVPSPYASSCATRTSVMGPLLQGGLFMRRLFHFGRRTSVGTFVWLLPRWPTNDPDESGYHKLPVVVHTRLRVVVKVNMWNSLWMLIARIIISLFVFQLILRPHLQFFSIGE